jgi:hypothetical protein
MNLNEHRNKIIGSLVNEAESKVKQKDAPEENVELMLENGQVFASLDGLITVFKLNSRRGTLSKAEKAIFQKMINVLEKYKADAVMAGQLDVNSQFFYSGEKIIYIGGQLDTENFDKSGSRLEPGKEYTVFDNRKGKIGDQWFPVVTLEEFRGDSPDNRPGFLVTMFKKKPKEETKIVDMPVFDAPPKEYKEAEDEWPGSETGKDSPYS